MYIWTSGWHSERLMIAVCSYKSTSSTYARLYRCRIGGSNAFINILNEYIWANDDDDAYERGKIHMDQPFHCCLYGALHINWKCQLLAPKTQYTFQSITTHISHDCYCNPNPNPNPCPSSEKSRLLGIVFLFNKLVIVCLVEWLAPLELCRLSILCGSQTAVTLGIAHTHMDCWPVALFSIHCPMPIVYFNQFTALAFHLIARVARTKLRQSQKYWCTGSVLITLRFGPIRAANPLQSRSSHSISHIDDIHGLCMRVHCICMQIMNINHFG